VNPAGCSAARRRRARVRWGAAYWGSSAAASCASSMRVAASRSDSAAWRCAARARAKRSAASRISARHSAVVRRGASSRSRSAADPAAGPVASAGSGAWAHASPGASSSASRRPGRIPSRRSCGWPGFGAWSIMAPRSRVVVMRFRSGRSRGPSGSPHRSCPGRQGSCRPPELRSPRPGSLPAVRLSGGEGAPILARSVGGGETRGSAAWRRGARTFRGNHGGSHLDRPAQAARRGDGDAGGLGLPPSQHEEAGVRGIA